MQRSHRKRLPYRLQPVHLINMGTGACRGKGCRSSAAFHRFSAHLRTEPCSPRYISAGIDKESALPPSHDTARACIPLSSTYERARSQHDALSYFDDRGGTDMCGATKCMPMAAAWSGKRGPLSRTTGAAGWTEPNAVLAVLRTLNALSLLHQTPLTAFPESLQLYEIDGKGESNCIAHIRRR